MIKKLLIISIFSLLLGSTQSRLTEAEIRNNRDYYEVIGATTGKKIEDTLYAFERVIETHIKSVSAIKKALADESMNPKKVRVLLYYDDLVISDSSPPRMWQNKPHPDTVSSPWLDVTKTVTTSGETKITIRIDATVARLISDIYPKTKDKYNIKGFLQIPSIKDSCYSEIIDKYEAASRKIPSGTIVLPLSQDIKRAFKEFNRSFDCAPKELREPLRYLIRSSRTVYTGLAVGVNEEWSFDCQDEAEEYYSELYSRLAVRGLQILEEELNPQPKWWTEIIDQTKPLKKC